MRRSTTGPPSRPLSKGGCAAWRSGVLGHWIGTVVARACRWPLLLNLCFCLGAAQGQAAEPGAPAADVIDLGNFRLSGLAGNPGRKLGIIQFGKFETVRYSLTNDLGKDLTAIICKPSCVCFTLSQPPQVFPAGATIPMTATVSWPTRYGPLDYVITVIDSKLPSLARIGSFEITGDIGDFIAFDENSRTIDLGSIEAGMELPKDDLARVAFHRGDVPIAWDEVRIDTDQDLIQASVQADPLPAHGWMLRFGLRRDVLPIGAYRVGVEFTFFAAGKQVGKTRRSASLEILGDVYGKPAEIIFDHVLLAVGKTLTIPIALASRSSPSGADSPVRVLVVVHDAITAPHMAFTIVKEDETHYQLLSTRTAVGSSTVGGWLDLNSTQNGKSWSLRILANGVIDDP